MKNTLLFLLIVIITILGFLLWKQNTSITIPKPLENNLTTTQKTNTQVSHNIPHITATAESQNLSIKEKTNDATDTDPSNKNLSEESIIQKENSLYEGKDTPKVATVSTQVKETSTYVIPSSATEVKMKIKAKEKEGLVKAKISISHDMLTYDQAKKKGLEANFITHVTALVGEKIVYDASTSQFLSKNPLIKFSFVGKKGEELKIVYTELTGKSFFASKKIK